MNRKALIVGIVVLLGVALLYAGSRYVQEGRHGGAKALHLSAHFHDATGLVDKSRVQIAGLNVGQIYSRELDGRLAKVTVAIEPDIAIWSNAVIYKKSASLLGEFYLEIDPGSPKSVLADGTVVENRRLQDWDWIVNVGEPTTADQLMRQVGEVVPVLRDALQQIDSLVAGPIRQTTTDLDNTIRQNQTVVSELLRRVDDVAGNLSEATGGETASDIRDIVARTRDAVDKLDEAVGKANLPETATSLRGTLDRISETVDRASHMVDNLAAVSDTVRSGQGTVGELLENPEVADNVAKTVQHTERLTSDAAGFVHSLTRLQTIVGLRTEYNVLASTMKTYVQLTLAPRPDKYYLIELVDDPRGLFSQRTDVITSNGVSYTTTTQELSDRFRFTFQFAKIIDFATFRFGIKESTGGIGLDLALTDRFAIFSDLFDTRVNTWPRLKVMAAYRFFEQLYVVGGVDDILNSQTSAVSGGSRDYFFGAWLRFNDEDLKGLLAVGGASLVGSAGSR